MYSVTKTFEFEASHKLILNYESPCSNIHGHSYKVTVELFGEDLDNNGMVIDFTELKYVKNWVMDNWDHALIVSETDPDFKTLNQLDYTKVYPFKSNNVTAELMARQLFDIVYNNIRPRVKNLKHINIEVWETSSNRARFFQDVN
jgi:6-pyruvoyltetrahydropterin/6-carboxytetrahydropterin synthase